MSGASALTIVTTYAIQAIGLATGVLVARVLGVSGRGELAAVVFWISAIAYIGDLGLPIAYTYQSAQDSSRVPALLRNAAVLTTVQTLTLVGIGYAVIGVALHHYPPGIRWLALEFLLAYVPLYLATGYLSAIARGLSKFRRMNLIRISVPVSYLTGLLAVFALDLRSVSWVIVATVVSEFVALLVAVGTSRGLLSQYRRSKIDTSVLASSFRYGLRGHLGNLTPVDGLRLDLLVVTAILTAHEAGLYAVALSAVAIIRSQAKAVGLVVLPRAAEATSDQAVRVALVARACRIVLLSSAVMAIILIVFAGPLLAAVYGDAFRPAANALRILAVAIVAASLRQVLADGLRGLGHPGAASWAEVASLAVGAAALAVLVPRFGLTGAAAAIVVGYLTALIACLIVAGQLGLRPGALLVPQANDLTALASTIRSACFHARPLRASHSSRQDPP